MKLKNYEIYNYTLALQNVFNDNEKYIPIKIHTANPVGRANMERTIDRYWP